MVLLVACLCCVLVVALDIVVIAGSLNTVDGKLDLNFKYQQPVAQYFQPGALLCVFVMMVLCVVLPLLTLYWAALAMLTGAVSMLALQFVILPFDKPAFTGLMGCLGVIGVAYLFVRLVIVSLHRRQVNRYLQQYVPPQLVSHYMQSESADLMVGESRDMTIMFCDIKRFTGISERLNPEYLPDWLNRFFDTVSEIVVEHNGTIDKYIGDSVMAFWGAPEHSKTDAVDALMAARKIIPAVENLSAEFAAENLPAISVGIGLSTGSVNVGHLGSKERMTYTVVGDAVNTADRLQRCTGAYELSLVVNDRLTEQVPDYLFRELDTVYVKGRQRHVRIFQPICHNDDALPNTHRRLQMHRKAMQFCRRQMWADAEKLFRALGDDTREHAFYSRYIERVATIRQTGASQDTDFIVDFTQKIG